MVLVAVALGACVTGAGRPPAAPTTWPLEAAGADAPAATAAAAHGWGAPAWADEFAGDTLDPRWSVYDSPGHDGNGSRRPSQVTVAGGVLTQAGTADAVSAGMARDGDDARFGRWEVRARADGRGPGARPYHAVIALIPATGAYDAGERDVDFAEADVGTGEVNLFVHYPPRKQDYLAIPLDLAAWHTFAVEVAPDHVTWFVDGAVRATVTRPAAIPTRPMKLNVQLDAYRPGDLVPARLQVDWARFHRLPPAGTPVLPGPVPPQGDYDPGR
ncbi:glycoside hydrolase family 16 protein [Actinomycetospora termitidis]|uniref:Glycoside hydrolase family 16 protein n=1 Tax=Actinomycetospora termitidis TaxID=3053470 RepID=A0ABT7MJH2_9PSEU|nr:glycoside hydrolase family 16 protein [Actinomycetospora sp. Odt1-22]MDL5160137.1 glycoside hydrolase family 16 protein [Actinomycetospora sp. Odt1-22]